MPDNQDLRERLKLKYLPFDPDPAVIAKVEAFLAISDNEQVRILESSYNEDAEFWINVMTARALYQNPVDKRDGSITEEKVARYPERYK